MTDAFRRRLRLVEGVTQAPAGRCFVDRPPDETREEWLARRAGTPLPSSLTKVNANGETREAWVRRRCREMGIAPERFL
jgi:hypothetical protein